MLNEEDEALEEDAPANNNWDVGGFNPHEVPVIGLYCELFASEVVAELGHSEEYGVSLLLVCIPVNGSTRVLLGCEGDGLMYDSAVRGSVKLEQDRTDCVVR